MFMFVHITVLCLAVLPTCNADANQQEKVSADSRGPITFESQWREKLNLSRDLLASFIPHSRRRGLLSKYRRKSDTKAKVNRILEARKQRDQLLDRLMRDKARANIEHSTTTETKQIDQADATKGSTTKTKPQSRDSLIKADALRDGIIDALLKDRALETHELDGDWNAEKDELLERAEEIEEIEAYLNGSNGHIWDRKARGAERHTSPERATEIEEIDAYLNVSGGHIWDRKARGTELEGDWNTDKNEILKRADQLEEKETHLNGSDGHIWDRKARQAGRDELLERAEEATETETHLNEGHIWERQAGGAEKDKLLERDEEIEGIEVYRNGSEGHIWERKARGAEYDPDYDWENGGQDYSPLRDEGKKESKFEKYAKHWQKHALKAMFALSFICMILCCCIACCKKIFGRLCEICCWHLKEWRDVCLNRDPTYRRIRAFADDYGLELDYDQYEKLKHNYEEGFKKQGDEMVDFSGRN